MNNAPSDRRVHKVPVERRSRETQIIAAHYVLFEKNGDC
jgi:hypothetical protein